MKESTILVSGRKYIHDTIYIRFSSLFSHTMKGFDWFWLGAFHFPMWIFILSPSLDTFWTRRFLLGPFAKMYFMVSISIEWYSGGFSSTNLSLVLYMLLRYEAIIAGSSLRSISRGITPSLAKEIVTYVGICRALWNEVLLVLDLSQVAEPAYPLFAGYVMVSTGLYL